MLFPVYLHEQYRGKIYACLKSSRSPTPKGSRTYSSVNVPTMPQPEAYIGNASSLFNERGELINEDTRKFMKNFMDAFAGWVDTFLRTA